MAFGMVILGVPCVRALGGIWQLPCGGAVFVGFSGVVCICLMRLPCVSATAEAFGIGILGIPHVLTFGGCWYRPTGGIYRLHGLLLVWVYEGPFSIGYFGFCKYLHTWVFIGIDVLHSVYRL